MGGQKVEEEGGASLSTSLNEGFGREAMGGSFSVSSMETGDTGLGNFSANAGWGRALPGLGFVVDLFMQLICLVL